MSHARYDFASDNTAGACPEALDALIKANDGFTSGYGTDAVTRAAADRVRERLDADADVRFVASGTAANAIVCAALCRPFEAVLAHEHAHILTDETGAPGYFGQGLGLVPLAGASGRIELEGLKAALSAPEVSHRQSPAALSLTNATEYGSVYDRASLSDLIRTAKDAGLGVHLDGARLANAAAAGFDVRGLGKLGVDVLVMGGTKAGATLSEAVVIFNPELSRRFDARLKQAGQLASKGRYLSAPWLGLLREDAWTRHAAHANAMARRLAEGMPFKINHPVDASAVFVEMDGTRLHRLHEKGWFVYRFLDGSVRFMCSWQTRPEAVDELLADLATIARS